MIREAETRKPVAAIIPNYNYEEFIGERIDSILKQTYPIAELIILDDASTDGSAKEIKKKIKQIKQDYPNIEVKFLRNQENSGGLVFSQWQRGLKEVNSDFIWIAEADDLADGHFLETAMKKFEQYPSIVLFYSDSQRINENGELIANSCVDLADIWGEKRWENDYFNEGKDEIINYLSATNPIVNVSGVVWRNIDGLSRIFEEAKNYKIAGDWYIYTRVLENGDIAYSAKPLNKYRKHNRGSVTEKIKLGKEYAEVREIQRQITEKYNLPEEKLKWQKVRRRCMGMVENEQNLGDKGRIAWVVPGPIGEGGGGHNTIFRHANNLIDNGYTCDLYVTGDPERMPVDIYNDICKWYGEIKGDVYNDLENPVKNYDLVIATGWDTAEVVKKMPGKEKLYFIQDYEPWFFGMGDRYMDAKKTYKYGFKNASIGKWLPKKLNKEFGIDVAPFSFGAELDIYHPIKNIKKEDAVCFIYQPIKARRCVDWGLKALQIVHELRPEVKIYLYGSPKATIKEKNIEHLGILKVEECNELYNKCKVGLCLSSSNPSRVPFEMMAAGLPVVDLHLENNLYDFPEEGCLLAEPEPKAIAAAILKILDDSKLQKELSRGGEKYMKDFPQRRELFEFNKIIDGIVGGKEIENNDYDKIYKRAAVKPLKYRDDIKVFEMEEINHDLIVELNGRIEALNQEMEGARAELDRSRAESMQRLADYETISKSTAFKIGKKITWLPHKILKKGESD